MSFYATMMAQAQRHGAAQGDRAAKVRVGSRRGSSAKRRLQLLAASVIDHGVQGRHYFKRLTMTPWLRRQRSPSAGTYKDSAGVSLMVQGRCSSRSRKPTPWFFSVEHEPLHLPAVFGCTIFMAASKRAR